MGWRFIQQPNGLLARFSTITDDVTHYDMTDAEAMLIAVEELDCGKETAMRKIGDARNHPEWFAEAYETFKLVHEKHAGYDASHWLEMIEQPSPYTPPPAS